MRRSVAMALCGLMLTLVLGDQADAQRGFGGGGFRGGGFGGGGFRAAGFGGGGFRAAGIGGGRWAGAGFGRPGWGGGWAGHRPGWGYGGRWPLYGAAVGLGIASAAYYGSSYPYGYGYGYPYGYSYGYYAADECALVRQRVWDRSEERRVGKESR